MSGWRVGSGVWMLVLAALPGGAQQGAGAALPATPAQAAAPQADAAAQAGAGTQADTGQPVMTLHETTRLVVLDVVVTDGQGHSVKGLKPSDFALTEDGVRQRIASFAEHDAAAAPKPAESRPTLPPDTFMVQPPVTGDGAMTVIVLASLGFADAPFVRSQLRDYLKSAEPATPIAIFRQDWQGMHLVQGFTADREVLLEAVNSKRMMPPLGSPTTYAHALGSPTEHLASYLAGISGRINLIWFGGSPPGARDSLFPDRDAGVPPELTKMVETMKGAPNVLQLNRVALYPVDAAGVVVPAADVASFGSLDTSIEDITASYMQMISPDPQLFSLQTSGLMQNPQTIFADQDVADAASATGGAGFYNNNGFKEIIGRVVETGSHFYTLSYSPTNANWDGGYRRIRLAVAGIPVVKSTQSLYSRFLGWSDGSMPKVLYRRGYFASAKAPVRGPVTPDGAASATATTAEALRPQRRQISVSPRGDPGENPTAMQTAMAFARPTPFQLHFTMVVTPSVAKLKTRPGDDLPAGNFLTAPFRDGAYKNYRVHYWVDPHDLRFVRTAKGSYRDDLQFVAIAYRDDGVPANSAAYTTHVEISAEELEQIETLGMTFDQEIAVPVDGSFFLRTGVNETATGHIGAIEVPAEWVKPLPEERAGQ